MKANKPLIIAHRGTSGDAPENTLLAFRRALEVKADGIELDVQLSKDNIPMVFHDKSLKRIANRKEAIAEFTAAELGNIDAGSWFNRKYREKANPVFSNEGIPTLASIFELMRPHSKKIYVELKCDESKQSALVSEVGKLIEDHEIADQIIILSFNHSALMEMKSRFPELKTGALFAPKPLMLFHIRRQFIRKTQECGASEMALHYSLAKKKTVEKAADHEIPVAIWTANRMAWVKRAIGRKISAVFTNYPQVFLEKREEIFA